MEHGEVIIRRLAAQSLADVGATRRGAPFLALQVTSTRCSSSLCDFCGVTCASFDRLNGVLNLSTRCGTRILGPVCAIPPPKLRPRRPRQPRNREAGKQIRHRHLTRRTQVPALDVLEKEELGRQGRAQLGRVLQADEGVARDDARPLLEVAAASAAVVFFGMSGMVVQLIEEESTSGLLGKVAECKVPELDCQRIY